MADGGCGHGKVSCEACRQSRREFSAFLATHPTDEEKREWLMTYGEKIRERGQWPNTGC